MKLTFLLAVVMMLGYSLLLLSAVGYIQDKRMFTSAPAEIQKAVQPKAERFKGQHILGWGMLVLAVILLVGPVLYGAYDGIQKGFQFMQFYLRFIVMLVLLELFDIMFFDWVLLCHSNFFPHYYPEVKDLVGPHLFGYNMKQHITHILAYIPICLLLAWFCTKIG